MKAFLTQVIGWFARQEQNGNYERVVQVNLGGGDNRDSFFMQPSGDDAPPLNEDYAVTLPLCRNGVFVTIATSDVTSEGVAQRGEKRIYGRTENGTTVNQVHLQQDGTVLVSNDAGSLTLTPTGDVQITGNLIVGGNVTATGALAGATATVGGIPFATHIHGGVTPGSGSTGPAA